MKRPPRRVVATWYAAGLHKQADDLLRIANRAKARAARLSPQYQGEPLQEFETALQQASTLLTRAADQLIKSADGAPRYGGYTPMKSGNTSKWR